MTRYHVADAGTLEAVRQAINSTIPRTGHRVVNGVAISVDLAAEEARLGLEPEQLVHTSRLVLGDDGTAALELPETAHVEACLGRTIASRAIPRRRDLQRIKDIVHGVGDKLAERMLADSGLTDAELNAAVPVAVASAAVAAAEAAFDGTAEKCAMLEAAQRQLRAAEVVDECGLLRAKNAAGRVRGSKAIGVALGSKAIAP
jgi:hypothetical protein